MPHTILYMKPKIFLFGLDAAGKTSMSKYIKSKEVTDPRPSLGISIEKWVLESVEFQVWDAPGQLNLRHLWPTSFLRARFLMFLLDTSKSERFDEAKKELLKVLSNYETHGMPLVFCFHKMDLPESKENLAKARGIFKLPQITDRPVIPFQTSIIDGTGIEELKDSLVDMIQELRW